MKNMTNIGIIGCGVIGQRRANIVQQLPNFKILSVADINISKARSLGTQLNCSYFNDWKKITSNKDIDAVVVSTTNNNLAKISLDAIKQNKHVFCEKPLGVSITEVEKAVKEAKKRKLIFKTGFTLRFHPSIEKAKLLVDSGKIGKIMFIRGVYGITGRPGYEKEWRANKKISGGGELIDQGIHLIDLSRWFLGNFSRISGQLSNTFWKTSVEDNAFLLLKTKQNQIASLHVSWTEWKNKFSYEIYGTNGYIICNGLGGVYGKEKLIIGKKAPPKKWPPLEKIYFFENSQIAWKNEWHDFIRSIKTNFEPCGSGYDGLEALKIAFKIYRDSKI
jgi:predicted dehydrogenase